MATYITQKLIAGLQQQTENFLQKAVEQWQMLPPQKMLQQPGEGKWSAAQCLAHLNSYGDYYLPAIQTAIENNIQRGKPSETFTSGWLGGYFTNLMLPKEDGSLTKMPAPKAYTHSNNINSDEVLATFIDQQEKLLQLLSDSSNVNIQKIRIPISMSPLIRLRLGDVFSFIVAHNYRHVLQAERALQGSGITIKTASKFKLSSLAMAL